VLVEPREEQGLYTPLSYASARTHGTEFSNKFCVYECYFQRKLKNAENYKFSNAYSIWLHSWPCIIF